MQMTNIGTKAGEVAEKFLVRHLLSLARAYREAFPHHGFNGLEPAQLQVLLALRDQPDLSVRKIAEAIELARPSVSNAIKALQLRGYVCECRSDADGRFRQQHLTERGRALIDVFVTCVGERTVNEAK